MKQKDPLQSALESLEGLSPMLKGFFLASPVAFQIYSLDGRSLAVNQAFMDMFGVAPPPEYCLFEDSIAIEAGHMPAFKRAFAGGKPEKLPITWFNPKALKNISFPEGKWIAMESIVFPILGDDGKPKFGAFAFKDVTNEANYLSDLKETQFLLEKAKEVAEVGSWTYYFDGKDSVKWSKNEHKIFGLEEGAFTGSQGDFLSRVHPDDRQKVKDATEKAMGPEGSAEAKFRILWPTGEVRWVSERAVFFPAHGDAPAKLVGITKDITEEMRTEERAAESRRRYQALFDTDFFGYFVAKADGLVLDANNAFLEMVGYSRQDLEEGKISWRGMTPSEYEDADKRGFAQLEELGYCSAFEKEYVRKDGRRFPVLVGGGWDGDSRSEIISFVLDLTDQKRMELQYQQTHRLESIGRLAGGVAHDFNNILGIVLLYIQELRMELLDTKGRAERYDRMEEHIKRAIRLTKQLLTFGKKQVRSQQCLQLNRVISDMRHMLSRLLSDSVQLEVNLEQGLPEVIADLSQMEQVVFNLVSNAKDAVGAAGLIRISTEAMSLSYLDFSRLRLTLGDPGPYVCLKVEDSGAGISPEVLPHIFEPFFTTKEVGQGTGLGLATVYGAVKQSGGDIRIVTEVGRGTAFEVYLPAARA